MNQLISHQVICPYCGEQFEALIDGSEGDSDYTEDCYVCCRPIKFHCNLDDLGELNIATYSENETF